MLGKFAQCHVEIHKTSRIEVDGIDDPVVGNTTFNVIVTSCGILAIAVANDKLEPFGIVSTKHLATHILQYGFAVHLVAIEHCRLLSAACNIVCPCYGLLAENGDIESLTEVQVGSAEFTNRSRYGLGASVVDEEEDTEGENNENEDGNDTNTTPVVDVPFTISNEVPEDSKPIEEQLSLF